MNAVKKGLDLDRVVLLGRTLAEYVRFFDLNLEDWKSKAILDVASGVSSFTAEAQARGLNVTAFDRIYRFSPEELRSHCERDLEQVTQSIGEKKVYKWDFYKSPEGMRAYRRRAFETFLSDFEKAPIHYVAGELPRTEFKDAQFDLTLASYLLFVYEDQLSYDFHRESLLELKRITKGEIRIYPTVTFEAQPSKYLQRIRGEFPAWKFEIVPTDFEFLSGSANYLRIT